MYKAHRCKHCGKLAKHHSAFKQECMVNSRVIQPGQVYEADPVNFTVYPNAPEPRPLQKQIDQMFGSLDRACR